MRRTLSRSAGLFLAMVLMAGCTSPGGLSPSGDSASGGGFDDVEAMTLTLSDGNAESSASGKAVQAFAKEIEEKTDGKVKFEFYWSSSLFPATEALTALQSGIVDISFSSAVYYPEQLPIANWFSSVGTLNQSDAWPLSQMQSVAAMSEIYETNADLRAEFAKLGSVPLLTNAATPWDILCTKPVSTLDQANGTLIRTPGEPWLSEAKALGMTQVSVAYSEFYEAMQRKLVECIASVPASGFMPNSLWDIADYYTPLGMSGQAGAHHLMNKDKWDGLPEKVKDVINEAKPTYSRVYMDETLKGYATWAKEAPGKGIKFLDGSELRKVINDQQEKVRAGLIQNAPPGIADPQGEYNAYKESLQKWLIAAEQDFGIPATPLPNDPQKIIDTYLSAGDLNWTPFTRRLEEEIYSPAK